MDMSVGEAARRLGIGEWGLRKALDRGELTASGQPRRVTETEMLGFRIRRRETVLAHHGEIDLARAVVAKLHPLRPQPHHDKGLVAALAAAPRGRAALKLLGEAPFAVWGPDLLTAAAMESSAGCRMCWARMGSQVHGTMPPADTQAHRILLGPPCERDRAAWSAQYRSAMDRMAARISKNRPPAPRAITASRTTSERIYPSVLAQKSAQERRGIAAKRLRFEAQLRKDGVR